MKLLLISPNKYRLEHPFLINAFYNEHAYDTFCKGKKINNLFLDILKEVGYNIDDLTYFNFSDKSLI